MTEPTTIEKIDAMLAWLDEGTHGPMDVEWNDGYSKPTIMAPASGRKSDSIRPVYVATIEGDCAEVDRDARNIAALLNGVRPTLEAARDAYIVSGSIHRDYALDNIIEPLWQAFKEARDA